MKTLSSSCQGEILETILRSASVIQLLHLELIKRLDESCSRR